MENMEREGKNIIPSGMLYFNLSDKLLNLSEYIDNKDKIESECLKALRMKGIFLKDAKILEKMDSKFASTDGKFIDVSSASISKNSNKVLEQKEFENLCVEAKNILKNIGQEIVSGVVKIKPNKKADHCKYCEYSSVCRKDICV
jgi:ATP-dependent helicase/nuclease subunit B